MKRILIATDGSPSATRAVETGLELAVEHVADVTFVHVFPPDGGISRHVAMDEAETALSEAAKAAEAAGISYALEGISGETVGEIVAFADARDVDLILVGSRAERSYRRRSSEACCSACSGGRSGRCSSRGGPGLRRRRKPTPPPAPDHRAGIDGLLAEDKASGRADYRLRNASRAVSRKRDDGSAARTLREIPEADSVAAPMAAERPRASV